MQLTTVQTFIKGQSLYTGAPPPELVGRDPILEQARILLGRTKQKKPGKSLLLTGLRGVGKTVLLNAIKRMTRAQLISKGMIYSPAHGEVAFTVPFFDEFMRRTIPDWTRAS